MKTSDIIQIILFVAVLTSLTPVIGKFLYKVLTGKKNIFSPVFGKFEKAIYKLLKINPETEMNWKNYLWAVLIFNFFGFILLLILQLVQQYLPLNPQNLPGVSFDLAFNTAVSFITNTNWQAYAGETTMSYAIQMIGLTVQNFLSAATGIAVLIALIRGITVKQTENLGNFWVDMVRTVLYILLPLSILVSILLVSQGVIQNFSPYEVINTSEGINQVIPLGPAASQTAIKLLGTNGGGFFNTNSSHPFENPTPFSNFIEVISLVLISAALTYTYGLMSGSKKEGWIIYGVMLFILVCGIFISLYSEYLFNPVLNASVNLEGKELRFGIVNSVIWSTATSATSCGAVNAMHSSLSPLAGMVALINIMLGEVIFGGVGSGLYGMLVFVIITVFIAGLMVGRTPEYLGKKIESFEIKMAMIAVLVPNIIILVFSAVASISKSGLSSIANPGPHGLSEILYAFSSSAGNNGSAFAGLNANTPFYNYTTGIAMLIGRFGVIIPVMAIAGSLAKKNKTPVSKGTFTTDNYIFAVLLIGVILIVGALTHFPALSLGPIVEHLLISNGVSF
jgi:K+-transporting ATPase ATPase A chain